MEVQVQTHGRPAHEVCLLTEWNAREDQARWKVSSIVSVVLHIIGLLVVIFVPLGGLNSPQEFKGSMASEKITPLIAPPRELTQTEPNQGKVGKEFTLDNLLPRPKIFIPPSPRAFEPSAPAPRPRPTMPEPPKLETSLPPAQLPPAPGVPAAPPPPQIQAQEKPKIALENLGAPAGAGTSTGQPKLKVPSTSVDEAAQAVSRGRGSVGGTVVSDIGPMPGIGESMRLPAAPAKTGSTLELLSDPMGVDFHPYLIRILATVKRNWWAVMPESAKMGLRGRVGIMFAINRNGSVPKLVIATPSGTEALDIAAVAGISASNPFPPLPTEFKGDQIRLQFTFLYNARTN